MIAGGPPRRVLEVIADGLADLVLPEPVPAELRRVLLHKFGLGDAATDAILGLVDQLATEVVVVPEHVEPLTGDATDDRILAAAAAGGANVLITGDTKHLLPLRRHHGMRILKPQALLAEIAGA